jgi:hypothetical protein
MISISDTTSSQPLRNLSSARDNLLETGTQGIGVSYEGKQTDWLQVKTQSPSIFDMAARSCAIGSTANDRFGPQAVITQKFQYDVAGW